MDAIRSDAGALGDVSETLTQRRNETWLRAAGYAQLVASAAAAALA